MRKPPPRARLRVSALRPGPYPDLWGNGREAQKRRSLQTCVPRTDGPAPCLRTPKGRCLTDSPAVVEMWARGGLSGGGSCGERAAACGRRAYVPYPAVTALALAALAAATAARARRLEYRNERRSLIPTTRPPRQEKCPTLTRA